jgi:hypothetical protein
MSPIFYVSIISVLRSPVWNRLQPRELWNKSDRLPVKGRLGSSGNSSKRVIVIFIVCAGPPCYKSSQVISLRMPNKWRIYKEGQAGNKKRQRCGLHVFSELPSLPPAGSRSGYFNTSLGLKARSLIRVSLG